MSALFSGTITGRDTQGGGAAAPITYAARRFLIGADWYLAFYSGCVIDNGLGTPFVSFTCQRALLNTAGSASAFTGNEAGLVENYGQNVTYQAWCERVPRTVEPVLTYVMHYLDPAPPATTLTTGGVVITLAAPTPQVQTASSQTQLTTTDTVLKEAITQNGLVVLSTSGTDTFVKIITFGNPNGNGLTGIAACRNVGDVLYERCSDVFAYYSNALIEPISWNFSEVGPWPLNTQTNASTYTFNAGSDITANANPNAYFVQRNGFVTLMFEKAAPSASVWLAAVGTPYPTPNPPPVGPLPTDWDLVGTVALLNTSGADYSPDALAMTNAGAVVARVVYQSAALQLRTAYIQAGLSYDVAIADGTVVRAQYTAGLMYAFGADKIVWFCNEYDAVKVVAFYRVIDCTVPTAPTCSAPLATGFNATEDVRDMRFVGFSGGSMYVAVQYATTVGVFSINYTTPTSWTFVGTYFGSNANAIINLQIDTIEASNSALLVAVTDVVDATLYAEVLMT